MAVGGWRVTAGGAEDWMARTTIHFTGGNRANGERDSEYEYRIRRFGMAYFLSGVFFAILRQNWFRFSG